MHTPHHDSEFLKKLGKQTNKSPKSLRELASRKAGDLGISSPAALLLWAKEKGVSVTRALKKLPAEVRQDFQKVQGAGVVAVSTRAKSPLQGRLGTKRSRSIDAATVNFLLQDDQLRDRCKDLLLAKKHFDRVLREATTVLDDRLKKKSEISSMNPVNLVNKVLNPQKPVIQVSAEKEEQEGFHSICKGVMLAFRNRAHHSLSEKFTQQDALKFCGLIDTLLGTIERADVYLDRV